MSNMDLKCELLVVELELIGGFTPATIFPKTEEKLNSTEYQKALKFVAKRKDMKRYWSVMDFLFCESFPEWRFHAFRYYNDEGPALIDHKGFTNEKQEAYDTILCDGVLELCKRSFNDERLTSWTAIIQSFEQICHAV